MKRTLAARLLGSLAPPEIRASLLEDLDEAFARRAAVSGRWRASIWLWAQLLTGVVPLVQMRRRETIASARTRT